MVQLLIPKYQIQHQCKCNNLNEYGKKIYINYKLKIFLNNRYNLYNKEKKDNTGNKYN